MLTTLHVTNFRCFNSLSLPKLARVNLIVGTNNAGKTSLLDAIEILLQGGDIEAIWRNAERRGELFDSATRPMRTATEADVRHLFHGHALKPGISFTLEGDLDGRETVVCEILTARVVMQGTEERSTPQLAFDIEPGSESESTLALRVRSRRNGVRTRALSSAGGLTDPSRVSRFDSNAKEERPVRFLGTEALESRRLGALWDDLILTPEESSVVEALRIIEPSIERIAFTRQSGGTRGAFFLKLTNINERIPLGSMGDGLKRLLTLSLHMARSTGGSLLIDEIDTGLHYSVMVRMWRLLVETAKRLNVQVFVTTHSLDCILAIAELCEQFPALADEVLLHRVERGEETAVTYTASDLRVAAEQHMEVRGHAPAGK